MAPPEWWSILSVLPHTITVRISASMSAATFFGIVGNVFSVVLFVPSAPDRMASSA